MSSADAAGPVFAALADPTRRRMIERLAAGGAATATGLSAELPITRQAVAKHLSALRRAGLVRASRAGRETRYSLEAEPLAGVAQWVEWVGGEWDRRLERLGRRLTK